MDDNKDLTRAEFLRTLVYERPTYTNVFIEFNAIGKLPEDEQQEEEDEGTDEEDVENIVIPSQTPSSPSTQSACSTPSPTSSSHSGLEKKFICGVCNVRPKNVGLECSHIVCTACYEDMKNDRKKQCTRFRSKRKEKEEKKLMCPFSNCGQTIERVMFMDFDM